MGEFLDPTVTYLVFLLLLIVGAVGTGAYLAQDPPTTIVTVIGLGISGFVAGMYIMGHTGAWIGFMLVSAVFVSIFAYFLPMQIIEGLAAFLIGYIIGIRTERR